LPLELAVFFFGWYLMKLRAVGVARVLGLIGFVAGVALLAVVFAWAFSYLQAPMQSGKHSNNIGEEALLLAARVALLFVLGFVASAIAGRGIQLFGASFAEGRSAGTNGEQSER
jgi:UPF0716 family protein affecting phage T7 exclusion